MKQSMIPFLRPDMPEPDLWTPFLKESYDQTWFANSGPLYQRFSREATASYCSAGNTAILLSNATTALTAVLVAAGVTGRVVVPSFTFPATLHSVTAAGCTPVLCDADPVTWELNTESLKTILENQEIEAVISTRVFGFMRDLSDIRAICDNYGCRYFADSAAAFGHQDQKGKIGSYGPEAEVFSLHVTKVFGIGEGGLVVCSDELAAKIARTINFGFNPNRSFGDGMNAKIDEVRCAIALAMLDRIDGIIARRTKIAEQFMEVARRHQNIVGLPTDVGPTPWQTFPLRFAEGTRDGAMQSFKEKGIETRAYYSPSLSEGYCGTMATMTDADRASTPHADDLSHQMLCLPVYQGLSDDLIDRVAQGLDDTLNQIS